MRTMFSIIFHASPACGVPHVRVSTKHSQPARQGKAGREAAAAVAAPEQQSKTRLSCCCRADRQETDRRSK